eukprot:9238946-Pyramimonas_sp.AAC.2
MCIRDSSCSVLGSLRSHSRRISAHLRAGRRRSEMSIHVRKGTEIPSSVCWFARSNRRSNLRNMLRRSSSRLGVNLKKSSPVRSICASGSGGNLASSTAKRTSTPVLATAPRPSPRSSTAPCCRISTETSSAMVRAVVPRARLSMGPWRSTLSLVAAIHRRTSRVHSVIVHGYAASCSSSGLHHGGVSVDATAVPCL